MGGNRRDANRREITRQISDAFLTLYAQGGIDCVSVGALCEACAIARSTFYYYFEDKYAVLENIENELLRALWDLNTRLGWDLEAIRTGQPAAAAVETVRYVREHAAQFRILLGPYTDARFSYRWRQGLERHFYDCFSRVKNSAFDADVSCTIFSSSVIGLLTKCAFDFPTVTDEKLAVILGKLLEFCLYDFQTYSVSESK